MEPQLRCTVTEETHETRIEIVQDAAHRAHVTLDAEDVETLIQSLAECRAENPKPLQIELDEDAAVIDAQYVAIGATKS